MDLLALRGPEIQLYFGGGEGAATAGLWAVR